MHHENTVWQKYQEVCIYLCHTTMHYPSILKTKNKTNKKHFRQKEPNLHQFLRIMQELLFRKFYHTILWIKHSHRKTHYSLHTVTLHCTTQHNYKTQPVPLSTQTAEQRPICVFHERFCESVQIWPWCWWSWAPWCLGLVVELLMWVMLALWWMNGSRLSPLWVISCVPGRVACLVLHTYSTIFNIQSSLCEISCQPSQICSGF